MTFHLQLYIIFDFIESLTDWEKETSDKYSPAELYSKTWTECRSFVLPMNPQRKELEFAVKSVLNTLGVAIKIQPQKAKSKNSADNRDEEKKDEASAEKKKKNKKKKKPAVKAVAEKLDA